MAAPSAEDEMRALVAQGNYEDAWRLSDQLLIRANGDPIVLAFVAEVAFKSGRKSIAADLLVDAARVHGLGDVAKLNTALTGLLSAGRLFDGLELLREAVLVHPNHSELRRLLVDLLVATEQHSEASAHREALIRQRAVDLELLLMNRRYDRRTEEVDSLSQMMERNADDRRPLIGAAKRKLGAGDYDDAIDLLEQITAKHGEFVTAQAMLGRSLVGSGEYERLASWFNQLPLSMSLESDYWLTLGDWAMQRGDPELASQSYGRAAKLAVDRLDAWNKLVQAISSLPPNERIVSAELDLVEDRATLLAKLILAYDRFELHREQPTDQVLEISRVLMELGRLWEAEAWAAYGLSLRSIDEDDRQRLSQWRAKVVQHLSRQTPWQSPEQLPVWTWLDQSSEAAIMASFRDGAGAKPQSHKGVAQHNEIRHFVASGIVPPRLRNEAPARGLQFFGRTADDLDEPGILTHQMTGCGGGAMDFDLDGWTDLYFAAAGGKPPLADSATNAVFRNLGGDYVEVSAFAGGQDRGYSQGVAIGDVNEDGFDDVLVLNYGPNRLWINQGDGSLVDRSASWFREDGVFESSAWSTSAAIVDIDGDGISDAYIANYCAGLSPTFEKCRTKHNEVRSCSPNYFAAAPDLVLRGTSEGSMIDVSKPWRATPRVVGRGLGIVAGALDEIPGIDLLVANDMTANHFWTRSKSGVDGSVDERFRLSEVAALRGLATDGNSRPQGSMGIAVADLNHDERLDFYVTNFEREHNTLYMSWGAVGWNDQTAVSGLVDATFDMVGFGTQAIDFDNNGETELIIANGHVDHFRSRNEKAFYQQPMQLLQRDRQGMFQTIGRTMDGDYMTAVHVGRGLWRMDSNRDGKVDVVVTHQTEPVALLMNQTETPHSFVRLQLVGVQSLRTGVGSVITVSCEGRTQNVSLVSGDGYLSSNERWIHVGLGEAEPASMAEVQIRWPSGRVQTCDDLTLNSEWLIVEGEPAFQRLLE